VIRIIAEAGFDNAIANEDDGCVVQPGVTDDPGTRRDVGAGCERTLGAPRSSAGPAEHRYRLAVSLIAARLQTELLEPSI
jgi:hypothetical protein